VLRGAVGSVVSSVGARAAGIGGLSAGGTVAGIGGTSGLGRIAVGSGAILVGVVRGGLMGLRGASVVRFGGTSVVGIHAGVRERATPGVARRIRVGVQVTRVGVRAAVRGGASGLRIRAGAVAGTSVVGIGGRTGRRRPDRVGTTRRFRKGSPGPSSIVV
jgi:hypothetical protein